jgi:hypothetical protein
VTTLKKIIDPAIIERAGGGARENPDSNFFAELAARLEAAESENERLKGEVSIEKVKAQMMRPYANKVFYFVVAYCIAIGSLLILVGFHPARFSLPSTVLDIIAGSTATSVLGLIGIIVGGLFGARPESRR